MEKLLQIAEIQVKYAPKKNWEKQPIIKSSEDAYNILKTLFPADTIHLQEHFVVLYLNRANRVIGAYRMSLGGISGTVADPRLILGVALKVAASGIILAHNHPSGSLVPSSNDRQLTEKVSNAGKILEIKTLDHIIISDDRYFSFADEGMLL